MSKKIEALEEKIIGLMNERNKLEVETERLHGVLKKKNEHISDLEDDIKEGSVQMTANSSELERLRSIDKAQSKVVNQLKAKIKEISSHKDTMILSPHISGGEDIDEVLDNAVTVISGRLEKAGLKDKFDLIAVPHTIPVEIVR